MHDALLGRRPSLSLPSKIPLVHEEYNLERESTECHSENEGDPEQHTEGYWDPSLGHGILDFICKMNIA